MTVVKIILAIMNKVAKPPFMFYKDSFLSVAYVSSCGLGRQDGKTAPLSALGLF